MDFDYLYLRVREKEQRLFTNEQVAALPEVDHRHPHFKEWLIRRNSCKRLIRYLKKKKKPLRILEVGCGNGWLSAQMAEIPGAEVTGLDINYHELNQAMEVFRNKSNLQFILGEITEIKKRDQTFDIIVFASSLQYFPFLKAIVRTALSLLRNDGEIHIMDTRFYHFDELGEAQERSERYFRSLGYPEMVKYYFHHAFDDVKAFHYTIMYNPRSIINRIRKANPFYWIRINKI